MNSNFRKYAEEALAFTGFVVCRMDVAYRLRAGDIWQTAMTAGFDFSEALPKMLSFLRSQHGVELYHVMFAGDEQPTLVGGRSRDELGKRIAQLTGLAVESIEPYEEPVSGKAIAKTPEKEDGPPAHACEARRQWFDERGLTDPMRGTTGYAKPAARQRS